MGAAAFEAAKALVGVRFRLQGRDVRHGLDCVGLIWAAYAGAGVPLVAPEDYPMRGWSAARIGAAMDASGLTRCDAGPRQIGDAVLIALPAGQFHLGLLGGEHLVHAHAGLRRVVFAPFQAEWAQGMRLLFNGAATTEVYTS